MYLMRQAKKSQHSVPKNQVHRLQGWQLTDSSNPHSADYIICQLRLSATKLFLDFVDIPLLGFALGDLQGLDIPTWAYHNSRLEIGVPG